MWSSTRVSTAMAFKMRSMTGYSGQERRLSAFNSRGVELRPQWTASGLDMAMLRSVLHRWWGSTGSGSGIGASPSGARPQSQKTIPTRIGTFEREPFSDARGGWRTKSDSALSGLVAVRDALCREVRDHGVEDDNKIDD